MDVPPASFVHTFCDQCGVQARHRVFRVDVTDDGDELRALVLELCGHHYRRHAEALQAQGWESEHADDENEG